MLKHDKTNAHAAKASFDHIYDQPDPESYFRELQPLDYRAPQSALPIFQSCIQSLQQLKGRQQLSILDLCCGYGVNAALINYALSLDDLYAYYSNDQRSALPLVQRLAADQDFFASCKASSSHQVVGIDVARNALAYARLTGLMQQSFSVNLESQSQAINDTLARVLLDVDLIIVTGGLSYIGATTFRRLLENIPQQQRPWVICFPLRISDFQKPIAEFNRFGLRTERSDDFFLRQRKFFDEAEHNRVIQHLRKLKLDPTGKETDGYLRADFYLSRPNADVIRVPLKQLMVPYA